MGSGSFNTALAFNKRIRDYQHVEEETSEKVEKGAVRERVKFIAEIFGVAA